MNSARNSTAATWLSSGVGHDAMSAVEKAGFQGEKWGISTVEIGLHGGFERKMWDSNTKTCDLTKCHQREEWIWVCLKIAYTS